MTPLDHRRYFFDQGIRFTCQRCGACCTGAPGIVRVGPADIEAIAAYLNLTVPRLFQASLTSWNGGPCIREDDDGRCVFFADGCRIYPVRPTQCRAFPFWFNHLRSEDRWVALTRQCPGIGRGRRYSKEEILTILQQGW